MQSKELSDFIFACSRAGIIEVAGLLIQVEVFIDLKVGDDGISVYLVGRGLCKRVWATTNGGTDTQEGTGVAHYIDFLKKKGTKVGLDSNLDNDRKNEVRITLRQGLNIHRTNPVESNRHHKDEIETQMLGKRRHN